MSTITNLETTTNGEDSKDIINTNFDNLNDDKLELSGGTMTGQLNFSGTTHAGIKLLSLTTTQRDALTPANGMVIYNSTESKTQVYEGGEWIDVTGDAANASTTVKGITTMSVAPASADTPIAVGDNDPRMITSDEADACAGTVGTPSASNKFATAEETADYGKVIETLTAGETINGATLPVAVYQSAADNEIYACDGNDKTKINFIGFAVTNGTDGADIKVQFSGVVGGFTGLTEGTKYYVQDDKTIGTTPGTINILVGMAISETQLVILKKEGGFVPMNQQVFSGNVSTSWTDLDLSAYVGNREVMAVLKCTTITGLSSLYLRTNGETLVVANTADGNEAIDGLKIDENGEFGTMMVKTDSSGIIEHLGNGTINWTITLTGYIY